jgi:hypothetical protein
MFLILFGGLFPAKWFSVKLLLKIDVIILLTIISFSFPGRNEGRFPNETNMDIQSMAQTILPVKRTKTLLRQVP